MLVYIFHISSGLSCMAIFVAPMLLDFWITPPTVSTPNALSSVIGAPSSTKRPPPVSTSVVGVTRCRSSASETVNGFMIEPGSNVSVRMRLRNWSPVRCVRSFGL